MLCQTCDKKDTCTEICDRAEKYVSQDYRAQFELTVGEPEYDDSSIWPDDPETELDPGLLALQTRGIWKAKIDRMGYQGVHQAEDDHEHTGPGLKGRHVAKTPVESLADRASHVSIHSEDSLRFESITPLQKKCFHLFYFERLTYAQIAQRVRKNKTVVKGQLQRARAKLLSEFSKGKDGKEIDIEKIRKEFPLED